jgi:hypothetical protein
MVNSFTLQMGEDWKPKQDLPRCFINNLVLDGDLLTPDVHGDVVQAFHHLCLCLVGCSVSDTLIDMQR